MRAMIVEKSALIETNPLRPVDIPIPEPQGKHIQIRVQACAACLTDLHVAEGDIAFHGPVVPGHQIIGTVSALGPKAKRFSLEDTVGVAWLYETCGICRYCRNGLENLCETARFTGYDVNGGYAEYLLAQEDFVYPLPPLSDPVSLTPLLCAGIIGYRALRFCDLQPGDRLGMYGFGSSAHITTQIARYWGTEIYVFTRSREHRELALELGATWVGTAEETPPHPLNASIIFAPAGYLVPKALANLARGGKLILAGIHMTTIPEIHYDEHLYYERSIQSIANNTRTDGSELMTLAMEIPITTRTQTFRLIEANEVLSLLKRGQINGTAVLELKSI